jgi:hypothetical protein
MLFALPTHSGCRELGEKAIKLHLCTLTTPLAWKNQPFEMLVKMQLMDV